jgi:ribosomal protein S18 acetylase RimI-like enzyme
VTHDPTRSNIPAEGQTARLPAEGQTARLPAEGQTVRRFAQGSLAGVRIVRLAADQLQLCRLLWKVMFDQHVALGAPLPPRPFDEAWEMRTRNYEKWLSLPDTFILGALNGDELVGFVLTRPYGVSDTWQTQQRVAMMESIAIYPEWQGKGLGSAMMDEVERQLLLRGIRDLYIDVEPANAAALRLYDRRGYAPTSIILHAKVADPPTR